MNLNLAGSIGPNHMPNCGVTAVAVCAGVPFEKAWDVIKNRVKRGGSWKGRTTHYDRVDALNALGVRHSVEYVKLYRRERGDRLKDWLPYLNPGLVYLVTVTGHAITVHDGQYVDQHTREFVPLEDTRLLNKRVTSVVRIIGGRA